MCTKTCLDKYLCFPVLLALLTILARFSMLTLERHVVLRHKVSRSTTRVDMMHSIRVREVSDNLGNTLNGRWCRQEHLVCFVRIVVMQVIRLSVGGGSER